MTEWLLLIYTLPSQPSRYRAAIWRELKKLGALYLRDGVAVLPLREDLEQLLTAMAGRIEEYGGTVELVAAPRFVTGGDSQLVERFKEERSSEYREVYHACVRFLRDVLEEVNADEFGFPDVDNLESELIRLRKWYEQIQERDYFGAPGTNRVREILGKCERAFERFVANASQRDEALAREREDVYEALGGPGQATEPVPEDFPL